MPYDLEDVQSEVSRQQAQDTAALMRMQTPPNVAGAITGLGQALAGFGDMYSTIKDAPLQKARQAAAAQWSKLEYTKSQLGAELAALQASKATEDLADTRRKVSLNEVIKTMTAGQNPLEYLPQSTIEASGVPVRLGALIQDASGNMAPQSRQIITIGDWFGKAIDKLPSIYQPEFLELRNMPATKDFVDTTQKALENVVGHQVSTMNNLNSTNPKDDPNKAANATLGRMAQYANMLIDVPVSDAKTRGTLVNAYNGLVKVYKKQIAATGQPKEVIDSFSEIPPDVVTAPPPGWSWSDIVPSGVKNFFFGKKAPDAAQDNPTKTKPTTPPPAVVGATAPSATQGSVSLPKKRPDEPFGAFVERIKAVPGLSVEQKADAVQTEYPGMFE